MSNEALYMEKIPQLKAPLLIAGFEGWGNALDVANTMTDYLIRKLNAEYFAAIDSDMFYRYDEIRPHSDVHEGELKDFMPPGGAFYAARPGPGQRDLIILKANEPHLQWLRFADTVFRLCEELGVKTVITVGSMYDNVLHSDRIISGMASDAEFLSRIREENIGLLSYEGPGAIHAMLQSEGERREFRCASLWCHCPFYIEGVTHFGVLAALCRSLAAIGGFNLDIDELEEAWKELSQKINELIDENPNLQEIVRDLRKAKLKGSMADLKESVKNEKIINLQDFLNSR